MTDVRVCHIAVVFALAVALAGCGGGGGPPGPLLPNRQFPDIEQGAYLARMRSDVTYAQLDSEALLELGRSTCTRLDKGDAPIYLVGAAEQRGIPEDSAKYALRLAVAAFCPEYRSILPD